jgi:hypothetical protein
MLMNELLRRVSVSTRHVEQLTQLSMSVAGSDLHIHFGEPFSSNAGYAMVQAPNIRVGSGCHRDVWILFVTEYGQRRLLFWQAQTRGVCNRKGQRRSSILALHGGHVLCQRRDTLWIELLAGDTDLLNSVGHISDSNAAGETCGPTVTHRLETGCSCDPGDQARANGGATVVTAHD